MLPETPYVLYIQLQHQNAHRNGAIKHIFFTDGIHGRDHQQIVLYSFVAPCALLHLAVPKILLQIFLYEDLSTLTATYICHLYFPPECQQDRTLFTNQYY